MKKEYIFCTIFTLVLGIIVICNIGNVKGSSSIDQSISQIESEINENESKYEEIQNKLDELNRSKENLAEYIVNLNDSYNYILQVIEDLDAQIEKKNSEIESIDLKVAEAEAMIDTQYDEMCLRIQFLYENNSTNIIDAIFRAANFEELINRMVYYNDIVEYDRSMLDDIEATIKECNIFKEELLDSINNLNKLKDEQNTKKQELESMMADASVNISNHQSQIDAAEAIAIEMVNQMEEKRNSIQALKEEESRRLEELARKESMAAAGETEEIVEYAPIDGDLRRLAAIIYCEARGEPYEGQLAVASVVLNRVESTRFPNTIDEVISQPNQFTPYGMGLYAIALAKEDMQQSCIDAAREVLENGVRVGDWLFFRTINNIVQGTYIGNHVFY